MDIAIRGVGETSMHSGEAFTPGEAVWSCLYRSEAGHIERGDVRLAERGVMNWPGTIICQWGHRFREKEASEAEERRAALQSADEIFLSLFESLEEGPDAVAEASRDRLKFFLALHLERKRVLKPLGGRRFRHMPTKRELLVPDMDVTSELIADFQEEISLMGPGL